MKTKEELNALRLEVKALNAKLAELTDDEMNEVTGGVHSSPVVVKTDVFRTGGGDAAVKNEDILKEIKLPDFNLN